MIADKKRKEKRTTAEEPQNRFYVRKWQATKKEMSEVREYIKSHKSTTEDWKRSVAKSKASRIKEKLVR